MQINERQRRYERHCDFPRIILPIVRTFLAIARNLISLAFGSRDVKVVVLILAFAY